MAHDLAEQNDSMWALAASPLIWAAHMMLSYVTAAVYCAKWAAPDDSLAPVRLAVVVYTVAALVGVAAVGWRGFMRHRRVGGSLPHDADSPDSRYGFLGFATLLLSGLSAVAVIYQALPAVLIGSCR